MSTDPYEDMLYIQDPEGNFHICFLEKTFTYQDEIFCLLTDQDDPLTSMLFRRHPTNEDLMAPVEEPELREELVAFLANA